MPDWHEHTSHEPPPARRVEHALRYRLAAPVVRDSATWADLGCGHGADAAEALQGAFTGRALLVDVEEERAKTAARELGTGAESAVVADLTDAADVARVKEQLLAGDGPRLVTCFEVIPHLRTFVPLADMLVELATGGDTTVLLSVPNEAFWAIENPYHETMWGEGSFEELRRMLPEGTVVVRQVALQGSALVPLDGAGTITSTAEVELRGEGAVPTHLLAAMGPRAGEVAPQAAVAQVDLDGQRRWERERESDLAFLSAQNAALQAQVAELRAELGRVSPQELPSGETA